MAVILVTGSTGQLGSELRELSFSLPEHQFHFLTRKDVTITDEQSLCTAFETFNPHYFINCAAYTAVDQAEDEQSEAFAINAEAVGIMARLSKKFTCRFIHISTDYVFDGTSEAPLNEDAPVSPVNMYGASKLKGEQLALKENEESVIIRTSWVYSYYGKNFVKMMIRLMNERDSISVVADQTGSPTYAADLAEAILKIVAATSWHPGIYHYCNEGHITWYDFAVAIRDAIGSSCEVKPITTEQFPTPAKRPRYSVMNIQKIQANYGVLVKNWKESLSLCLNRLQHSGPAK